MSKISVWGKFIIINDNEAFNVDHIVRMERLSGDSNSSCILMTGNDDGDDQNARFVFNGITLAELLRAVQEASFAS